MEETIYNKVSVITVTYNALDALKKTADSVARQDYPELEYIVVDGSSTDGTKNYLAAHADSITRWVSEPDHGIYDAMNKGSRMATGDYLIFMNAGDQFAATDVLRRVFGDKRLHAHEADIIYGDVVKNGRVKVAEPIHNSHRMIFCHQSSLIRRECLAECPYDTRHRMSADFKFFKQMYLSGKRFVQVPFAIADYDVTGVSNRHRSLGLRDNIRVVSEVDSFIERLRLLPRLWFVYLLCRLRGK